MDTLLSLKVFRSVVETGSFAAAASRENLSAAMASRHLMHLERSLHVRLLNRTTRQISLTEAGGMFYSRCRTLLEELEDAEMTLANLTVTPQGTLKLTAPSWFGGAWFAGVVIGFQSTYPDVVLDINFTDRFVNIVEEGYDLAVRVTFKPPQSFIARQIGPMPYLLLASPAYLERRGKPDHPNDLSGHSFITCVTSGMVTSPDILEFWGKDGRHMVKTVPVLQVNNPTVAREAAMAGVGLAALPSFLTDDDVAKGTLTHVLPGYTLPEPGLYALYASRHLLSPKVRVFIDYFLSRFSGDKIPVRSLSPL